MITKIQLENFMAFYGIQSVFFKRGINLVVGNGGTGKSSFLQSILWSLGLPLSHYHDEKFLFNRKKISELSLNEVMEVKTSIEIIYRGDTILFERTKSGIKKDDYNITVTSDSLVAYRNGQLFPYPDLVARDIYNFEFANIWYIDPDYYYLRDASKLISSENTSKEFIKVLNCDLKRFFSDRFPEISADSENRLTSGWGLSETEALCVYLCIWRIRAQRILGFHNSDVSIFVDGIYMHQEIAPLLGEIWKGFSQMIICWQERDPVEKLGVGY